jgi:vacuolar-type H+-ATPase subunit I/STV1
VGAPRPPVEIPAGGLDMDTLANMFASKHPPENTIVRIEALEKQVANLLKNNSGPVSAGPVGSGLDADAMDKLNDLLRRVQSLETRADKNDREQKNQDDMLSDHERRIKALENMDMPVMTAGGSGSDIDTASILKAVSMIKNELTNFKEKTNSDLESLRIELKAYTDKETTDVRKETSTKIKDLGESLKYELDRLRAEFENFKNRDHKDLEARVTALEKKFARLSEAFNNLKIPDSGPGGGVSEEAFRQLAQKVADLEDALNHLRNEFAKWMKEM